MIPVQLTVEEEQGLVEENKGAQAAVSVDNEERESPDVSRKIRIVSPLKAAGQAKVTVSKWRKYARKRSDISAWREYQKARIDFPTIRESMRLNHHRINAAQLSDLEELVEITAQEKHRKDGGVSTVSSPSRALLYYFAKLAASTREEEVIDLEFVETLIENGASVNTADRHGQTLLHEAARQWDPSVARLLLERGKGEYYDIHVSLHEIKFK